MPINAQVNEVNNVLGDTVGLLTRFIKNILKAQEQHRL